MAEFNIIDFINIIETEGCRCTKETMIDGELVRHFLSLSGNKRVRINCASESMTMRTAIETLKSLELDDVIIRMNLII